MKDLQYNENKQHGTPDFPIQYYNVDITHPQYIMPLHWHDEFEIIKINSGTFELFIENRSLLLKSGQSAIIECTQMHRGIPHDCRYECVVFSISMLQKKSNDIVRKYLRPIRHRSVEINDLVTTPDTKAAIDSLLNTLRSDNEYYELAVHRNLYTFFEAIYKEGLVHPVESRQKNEKQLKIMTDLLEWIDKNYTENITLSDLSHVAGLNKKYLCRFFKEYTGKTPVDYINFYRIEAACYEMTHSGMNVTNAAFECGFNSLSYFTKTFKKYKNISPAQYLKNAKTVEYKK